jgi:threonylcarbamoyladenosine tRNA methylthiotransferase MtaB
MATPQSIALYTLGCKLNFAESSSIARMFRNHGYAVRNFEDGGDIFVINTCSVTEFADRKCKKLVRQALRINPSGKIVLIGCYAQLKPGEISEIPGVDLVLGAKEKFNILAYIDEIQTIPEKTLTFTSPIGDVKLFNNGISIGDRTRSYLKIQDGCDYNCSFCTIPLARGKSRSNEIENIVNQAQHLHELGVKEIVLSGVNVGDYNNGQNKFIDLVSELDKNTDVRRYRISSIEPNLCNDDIIDFVAHSSRFMPHFHMPMQSGNNKQLRMMRRRYNRELYARRSIRILETMPEACIGADVIVGFPGETREDFEQTKNFILSLNLSYLHVFTYSERDHTDAKKLPGIVPMGVRRKRNSQLRDISVMLRRKFYRHNLGKTRSVLFEQSKDQLRMEGFTDNYIKVSAAYTPDLINTIQPTFLKVLQNEKVVVGVLDRV